MFKNYLLLALRNMRKNKLHAFINILGMVVAFACSIFIIMLVFRHFTYDNFELNKSNIYKVYDYAIGPHGEETGTAMPYPLTPALKAENIGIEKATSILNGGKLVRYKDKTLDMGTTMVDEDFLHIFTFPVVKGNTSNPLNSVSNAVLTEKSAAKIFNKENPIGKAIEVKLSGKWYKLTVTAVVKDFPDNSTIKFSVLARTELFPHYSEMRDTWNTKNHPVFVLLKNTTTKHQVENRLRSFSKKYAPVDIAIAKKNGYKPDNNGDYESLRLISLTDQHFDPQLGSGGNISKAVLYVLMIICGVIILIASFNFVNLNIGLSFTRTKEIGIRKCLGAGKKQVWFQIWGESFLMVFVSMFLAITIVAILIPKFNQNFNWNMSITTVMQPIFLTIIAVLIVVVSFIASGYPSSVMAKLKTVDILKGKISTRRRGPLRNTLIVVQFVIAIVLMGCTIIIFQQFDLLRSTPLGYNTQSIISIPIKNDEKGRDIIAQLRTRLASQPTVLSISGSDANLGEGEDHTTNTSITCFTYGDKNICGQIISSDYDFLKTLSIQPTSGRDFSLDYALDTGAQVIATKSYADEFGEKNITGFSYYADSSEPRIQIVGVIPDIQIQSLSDRQRPVVIYLSRKKSMNYALIKVNTSNPVATMEMVRKTYLQIEPGVEFQGSYVNENIDRLYHEEKIMATLFSIAAAIAIILSCMGLFGMASIVIRQRVKEIGIRKVLGAGIGSIVSLVSGEFVKPVVIAFLISIPLCWWVMHSWLENYSHRVSIHWWVFAIIGILAFLITILTIGFQSAKSALANPVKSLRSE